MCGVLLTAGDDVRCDLLYSRRPVSIVVDGWEATGNRRVKIASTRFRGTFRGYTVNYGACK